MKNLVDFINENMINESEADNMVYAVFGGYNNPEDFPNPKRQFDRIYVVKSNLRKAKMTNTKLSKSDVFDYSYIVPFDCSQNPNNVDKEHIVGKTKLRGENETIWVVNGRKSGSHTDLKIVAIFHSDREKEAKDFVNNMSSEMKSQFKQQYGVDTFDVTLAFYDR